MTDVSNARKIVRQLTRRVVSFFPAFAEVAGSAKAGLFLSQAFYWSEENHNEREDGWFFKTSKEWAQETFLTRHEQDTCREILESKGLLSQEVKGHPPKCYFKVQVDQLIQELSNLPESGKLAAEKRQIDLPESGKLSSIETTLKITEEIAPSARPTPEYCPECGFDKKMCLGHKKPKNRKFPNRQRFEREIVQRVEEKSKRSTGEERAALVGERAKVFTSPDKISARVRNLLPAGSTDRASLRNIRAWAASSEPD